MSPRFFYRVVYVLSKPILFGFGMFVWLRQQLHNLNFPGRLVLFASLILSACTGGGISRKVWSTPEIIDDKHSDGGPNTWELSFDAQGNGMFVTDDIDRVWANRYTADSGWGNPELIDDMANPAEDASYGDSKQNVRFFFSSNGNALALWQQYRNDDTPHKTWTNRYTVGTGWSKAEQFDNTPGDDFSPEIVGDALGNAFALWTSNKRGSHRLWAKAYQADAGWGKATEIAGNTGDAKVLMLKVDVLGNAYAVWRQSEGKLKDQPAHKYNVWISRYTAGAGWGKATLVIQDSGEESSLEMAFDSRGNALAACENNVAGNDGIWVSRYLVEKGWDQPVRIDPEIKHGDSREPVIAFDTQGNAMVMWWQAGESGHVFASRYTPAKGWEPGVTVSTQTRSALRPRFVYDKNGNALAVWAQLGQGDFHIIMASRYTADAGWATPVLVSANSNDNKFDPRIAIDTEGNAIATWWQRGRGASIWVNDYDNAKGWGVPKRLQADSTSTATSPEVVFDAHGIAHVSWSRMPSENQSYRVWSSHLLQAQLINQQTAPAPSRVIRLQDENSLARNSIGYTELHSAAYDGLVDEVAQLIADGMDIHVKDYDQATPLHVAAKEGQKEVVELLIAKGANVKARTRSGETPLHMAASWGTREVAEILIAKGANLHAEDGDRRTPLLNAATRGNTDTVELLIAKGADVNALTPGGSSALSEAVFESRWDIVALLLAKGAATNTKDGDETPLHMAANNGNKEIVELLLAHGAVVNAGNGVGYTPLHEAIANNHTAIAELLIAQGADVNAKVKDGYTLLHMAREKEAVALLIAHGANINAKGEFGYTPLHRAAREGRTDVVSFLIEKGADINDRDHEGESPLDVAQAKYQLAVVEILEAHGAKKGVESGRKYVPVDI